MSKRMKNSLLFVLSLLLISAFLLIDLGGNVGYILPRRAIKIVAIIVTGSAIAFSTVIFQTITNNRILTPSIIGLDSLYMLIQTVIVFLFGSMNILILNKNINFLLSVVLMMVFASLLFKLLFRKEGQNIYFLLLIGLIFGTLFGSLSSFMEMLIDPNEFQVVQDRMFASFNNVNTDVLLVSIAAFVIVLVYAWKYIKYLDVLSLGRDHAVNLGVNYDHIVKRLLIVISILVSISTALVGPITFLGLLVVNVAHEFLKTYRHSYLISGSIFMSVIALVGGQLIVERVFTFSTSISVIINFIGGVYFIYLLLKERKS
ncbi:iron chelate uptake ABC transporter family permease subunit [Alkalihalobacillus hwajinpoensis]|uniref:iron chelate uptake ABC transporter family permease subunit n=1 Tax=Guptibacillus hwajinpoensis TaxID=208199 RepID=UPI00188417BC|nr:iron chelate uptake ABC transporter family permease subunit [Pseudalkalibacillus hwajinpoensis]MBF0707461.1 iron chelate uptake ABC transporter family permease subunit [Pseudalkalibacillus hwajinpoensis]